MRIVSWNVNGLRAVSRKGMLDEVYKLNPDFLLLQETKADPSQLTVAVREPKGYVSFFSVPEERKGYSGVALYAKKKPLRVAYEINAPHHLNNEGRVIAAHYDAFTLFNVYFPNGGQGPHRLAYKLEFYDAFLDHIEDLRTRQPNIIFAGDVNTAHTEIDLARPKENEKNTGFLPEERAWLDRVANAGYVDVYRKRNPQETGAYTYWDMKTRARERNVGWRIDYIFVSPALEAKIARAQIHKDILGSDHCPISIDLL